jgi:hypothetical protein
MSARYDMEAAEPNVGQLRKDTHLTQVNPGSVEAQPLSDAGPRSTGGVA